MSKKKYRARGLTVREVREVYVELSSKYQPDVVDILFTEGIPAPIFYRSLDIPEAERHLLTDTDLIEDLMAEVAQLNPDLVPSDSPVRKKTGTNPAQQLDVVVSQLVLLGYSDPWVWTYSQLCQTLLALDKIAKDKK